MSLLQSVTTLRCHNYKEKFVTWSMSHFHGYQRLFRQKLDCCPVCWCMRTSRFTWCDTSWVVLVTEKPGKRESWVCHKQCVLYVLLKYLRFSSFRDSSRKPLVVVGWPLSRSEVGQFGMTQTCLLTKYITYKKYFYSSLYQKCKQLESYFFTGFFF